MNARTVLMCGGPADGRWVVVEHGARRWEVITPSEPVRLNQGPSDSVTTANRVQYYLRPIMILGHELWVGVAVDEAYDDRAVIRAILQRDVAAHLGAYR